MNSTATMTRSEFRDRWESDDEGGGITFDDVAECARAWGLYPKPRIRPMGEVLDAVLATAGVGNGSSDAPS